MGYVTPLQKRTRGTRILMLSQECAPAYWTALAKAQETSQREPTPLLGTHHIISGILYQTLGTEVPELLANWSESSRGSPLRWLGDRVHDRRARLV